MDPYPEPSRKIRYKSSGTKRQGADITFLIFGNPKGGLLYAGDNFRVNRAG